MSGYTVQNLKNVEDQAPKFGLSPQLEARRAGRNAARRRGAMLVPQARTQGASIAKAIGATEDAAWGRAARPAGTDCVSPSPPYASPPRRLGPAGPGASGARASRR